MREWPRVEVEGRPAWRAWLMAHHAGSGTIWLVTPKKGRPGHLSNDDIVEEALCFGWIDSVPRALDADRTMLLLSPRRAGSSWSAINKRRAERMQAAGSMMPAGAAAIAAAKADGSWDRLAAVDALVVPPDLAAALALHPPGADNFAAFPASAKRGILEWLQAARRPETRARRLTEIAARAARNERALQSNRQAATSASAPSSNR